MGEDVETTEQSKRVLPGEKRGRTTGASECTEYVAIDLKRSREKAIPSVIRGIWEGGRRRRRGAVD
jgi:hypothetical protein